VEQHSQSVVLKVAVAVAAPFDAFDAQVERFGRAVAGPGVMVGEDLISPRGQGAAQGLDLGHLVGSSAGDGLVDEQPGITVVVGEIDVAH
jgi:hypothetical protein